MRNIQFFNQFGSHTHMKTINLDELESSLVDTEPYQRLRWIKQLGSANLVYPGANHTRLEHSIGVSHLVKQMASQSDVPKDEIPLVLK